MAPAPDDAESLEETVAEYGRTLATESEAMDEFEAGADGILGESLASAVLHGGKGYVSRGEALDAVASTSLPVNGELSAERAHSALRVFEQHLSASDSRRFQRVLSYWWFVRTGEDLVALDPDVGRPAELLPQVDMVRLLRQLFSMEEIADGHIWERLASSLSLEVLQELVEQPPHPNLIRLVHKAGRNLSSTYLQQDRYLPPLRGPLYWEVRDSFLFLGSLDHSLRLRFTPDGRRLARRKSHKGPRVDEFLDRLGDRRRLRSIITDQGSFDLTLRMREDAPAGAMEDVRETLPAAAQVLKATVETAAVTATIDFQRNRFSTSQALSIQRAAMEAAELLAGMSPDELAKLSAFVGDGQVDEAVFEADAVADDTMTLFDDT